MADPTPKRERRRGKGEASRWGEAEAKRYEAAKHGPDGRRFLDDHLYAALSEAVVRNLNGKPITNLNQKIN